MKRKHPRQTYARWNESFRPPKIVPSKTKALVRLDTQAIRNKSLKEYRKAELNLDKLKAQLKRFREQDTPGFRTWLHQTFGSLLTRQRELVHAIQEKQALVREIVDLARRFRLSEVEAYRQAKWRRAHPEEAQAEDIRFEEEQLRRWREKPGERISPDDDAPDLNDLFDDDDFKTITDDDWSDFEDFYESMTGSRTPPRPDKHAPQEDRSARELYRTIIRQLHPDHHGAMSEARKELWHAAQEAYRHRDVVALYNILAQCGNGEAGIGQHSPVSLILRLTAQLQKAILSTRSEIRRMKTDMAWNYEERTADPRYTGRIRSELRSDIQGMEYELRSIDDVLAQLEREANRPQRKTQARHRRASPLDFMDDLPW